MNCERDIRFELLARLCPNSTGADIRSVCTEAGMYAIRARWVILGGGAAVRAISLVPLVALEFDAWFVRL